MNLFGATESTLQNEATDRAMAGMNTCLPGIIQSFDDSTQTAEVVPAIQMKIVKDNKTTYLDMPLIINVPVVFPFAIGNGFALTLPIKAGDSCLLIFSQRAIDNWHDQGGIQPPEQNSIGCRHHSLTDAFAIMAPAATPDVLGAWNSTGIEIRSRSRNVRMTVEENQAVVEAGDAVLTLFDTGVTTLTSSTSVTVTSPLIQLNGDVTIDGDLELTGGINADGDVADGVRSMAAGRIIRNAHQHEDSQHQPTTAPYAAQRE